MNASSFDEQREQLVERELRELGIENKEVLDAMRSVPREEFVSAELRQFAYRNQPLPIEAEQTISQPLIVAYMIEALQLSPQDRVLEVGAGSGYAAAVLSRIAAEVFTVERHEELAQIARQRLARLGYDNVHVQHSDGTLGWLEEAPFDAIIVAAASPSVPPALREQLAPHGRLVIPVGKTKESQVLIRVTRQGERQFQEEQLTAVRFVPLIGQAGWSDETPSG